MQVKESYERSPHKWNLSIMLSMGAILWTGLVMSLQIHSTSVNAHPVMAGQIQDIRADQIKQQIYNMDTLLCDDKNNVYYKQELIDLITKWEKLTHETFPRELLRCK